MLRKLLFFVPILLMFKANAQFEESSYGISALLPVGEDSESISNYGVAVEMRPLWDLSDNLYLGANLGIELYNVSVEGLEGESLNFIPVQASIKYYFLEYVYLNGDVGYAFNIDSFDEIKSDLKFQGSVGYSFDGFNLQLGYHLQKQNNFNLTSLSLGIYIKI